LHESFILQGARRITENRATSPESEKQNLTTDEHGSGRIGTSENLDIADIGKAKTLPLINTDNTDQEKNLAAD